MELAGSLCYSKSSKAGTLCPVPLKEPSESASPVADGGFFICRELSHRLSFTSNYKERVVAETSTSARRGSDFTIYFSGKCSQRLSIEGCCNDCDEART